MDISTTTKLRADIARFICREVCDNQGFERSKLYLDAADSILALVDKAQNPSKVVPLRRQTPAGGDAA